jgi:hypothetical protein
MSPALLTAESPVSWMHIAQGHFEIIDCLSLKMTGLAAANPKNKSVIAAAYICLGQACAQACEFALKGLLLKNGWQLQHSHNCDKLFDQLPNDLKDKLKTQYDSEMLKSGPTSHVELEEFLKESASKSVQIRYMIGASFHLAETKALVQACAVIFAKL